MKSICLIGACALVLFASSCNEKPQETKTVVIEKEVVKQTPPPAPVEKKTTIKVSPDGGTVKTKDVEVEVNK